MAIPTPEAFEQHCDAKVKKFGFDRASEAWNGCYWNPKLRCFLVVYVDDLKIAGPRANVDTAWKLIRTEVKMDPPEMVGRYHGCDHRISELQVDGASFRCMTYDMEELFASCVDKYT